MRHLTALVGVVVLSSCGLFGDDPPKKSDADASTDAATDSDTGPDPAEGALRGSWPQASIGRPEGVRPESLSEGWRVADNAAPGTGTGFIAAPCHGGCGGSCGIAFELADDRRIADLQVAVGEDDEVFINLVEGPDAQNIDSAVGNRSRLLHAVVDDDLLGRDELHPDLNDAASRAGLEFEGETAFLARDLMVVEHPDGTVLLAIGHIFRKQAETQWSIRDVALGLDPLTGRVRFVMKLPAEVFSINRPFAPSYQAFGARLLSDGRLVMWRDGFVETMGKAYVAAMPKDGETVELAPIALEEEGFPFSVTLLEVDRSDHLYVVGDELVTYPLCDAASPARPRARLRVFAPPDGNDAKLLHDDGGIARSFERIDALTVGARGADALVFVSGHAWSDPACFDTLHHYVKSPTEFSDDEDSLSACPTRLQAECASGPCACAGCQGLQQLCPPSIFGPPPANLVYLVTLDATRAPRESRAFAVPADGTIVTNGGDRALIAGNTLSLLDLGDAHVIWTLPGWVTESGIAAGGPTSLWGSWQTPLFSDDGKTFAAGLLATHTHNVVLDTGAIEHRTTQRGGIATGVVSPGEGLVAKTTTREVDTTSNLVATAESDRIFPLAAGRMLHVFSWRGPAVVLADPPTADRRLELHLLVPAALDYPRGRDLLPAAGEPLPVIARCTETTRAALDACAHRLPALVAESEVNLDAAGQPAEPREVSCQERYSDGTLNGDCNEAKLVAQWEDGQGETIAKATSGMFTVRCAAPTVRREPAGDQAVVLHVGCTTFVERFHPFASSALLTMQQRAASTSSCAEALGPAPLRGVLARVPFDVHVTSEDGTPIDEGEVGVVIVLTTEASGAGSVSYEIVSGSGVLDGNGTTANAVPGQPVDLEPTAEGVIVIRVRVLDEEGNVIGEQEIAIAIEGAQGCTGNADATVFKPCHPRLPYAPPAVAGKFEPRTSAAEAGVGVLLHDRSLRVTEVDVDGGDFGLPLALARTYRSAQREDGGGLMGGWHFALDVRLSPVTAIDTTGVTDTTWLLEEDLGANTSFDIAVADGSGRIDTYRRPSTTEVVDFASGPAFYVWDAAQARAVRKSFRARVATYTSPVDSFATLRSYTLILNDGQAASEVHPYWHDDRGFRPNERRFYELAEPDGLRRIFDCKGRLVLVIDAQLRELELVYGGPTHPLTRTRQLAAVIDDANRRWDIAWKTIGLYPRIARVTDPFGRTLDFGYAATTDGLARLIETRWHGEGDEPELSVTKVTRYRYDGAGRLIAVVDDVDGREHPRLTITWDGERVARELVGKDGEAERWTFSGSGDAVIVTDGRGTARTYTLGAVADGPRVVVSEAHTRSVVEDASAADVAKTATTKWTHQPSGLIASETSPLGRETRFTYSPQGLLTSHSESGPGLERTQSFTYENPNQNLAPGFACWEMFSSKPFVGEQTLYALPAFDPAAPGRACQPSEVTPPSGTRIDGQRASRRVRHDYVASGPHRGALRMRELLEDGFPQVTTTWTYPDEVGGLPGHAGKVAQPYVGLPTTLAEEVPHPSQCDFETLTKVSTTFVRDARGNITRSTLSRRNAPYVVDKTWDAADRAVETVVDPEGFAHLTTAIYDHRDRVVEERQVIVDDDPLDLLPATSEAREVVRKTFWDAAGREVARVVDGGDASMFELTRYDDASGITAVLGPGTGATESDIGGVIARLEDEPVADVIDALDPRTLGAANYTSSAPSGSIALSLDPRWVVRATTLDADGLPARLETTGGNVAGPCDGCEGAYRRVETSRRDLEGRLRVFDPGRTDRGTANDKILVEFDYDGLGRVSEQRLIDPEGCDGARTVLRREVMSDIAANDHVGAREVFGESGHADVCQTTDRLLHITATLDGEGRERTRVEHRFALLPALEPRTTGARTTTYEWDMLGRPIAEEVTGGDGSVGRRESTRYALANAACWSGSGAAGGTSYDQEVQRSTDELGLPAYETQLHHGANGTITVQSAFDYDAVGRVLRARDGFFQIRRELAYDSLGRVRAERDVRFAVHESRYDGLGQLIESTSHYANGSRTTALELRAGAVVAEVASAIEGGESLPLGRRAWRYDALARAAVAFPRGTAVPNEAVVTAFAANDEPLIQRTASGIVMRHTLDAQGNVVRAEATMPATPAPGWALPTGHDVVRTGARTYRYDGLGRITEASTLTLGGQRLTNVTRDYDSLSNVLRELQDLDQPSGRVQHVDSFADYDDRGRPVRVEADRGRNDKSTIEYTFDHLDRIVAARAPTADRGAPGLWEFAHPDLSWSWTGGFVTGRTANVGSAFDASLATTFTTTSDIDELGQRYRVRHAQAESFFEHRIWYWAGDPVLEKAVMFQGGVEQGDLGNAIAALPTIGVSQLASRPPATLFAPPADPETWDDNPWESRYEVRENDDAGMVVRALTHRYSPYGGNLSLSGRWMAYAGGQARSEKTIVWDPEKEKAIEIRDATFEWSADGTSIERATHRLVRKVNGPYGEPVVGDGTLNGTADERTDRLAFTYGGETQAAHDGCDLDAAGDCDDNARHHYVYDPWGQLEYVAGNEPDACSAPGPGMDDVYPVAHGLRVIHDALGRRVLERWVLPNGCQGPSALPAERDRSFVHLGDTLLEERVYDSTTESGLGIIRRVPGPEGIAWLAVRFGGEHRGHFVVFGDANGGIAGFYDVAQKALVQAGAPAPWFRAHLVLPLDQTVSFGMRLMSTTGYEQQPMGKLGWVPGEGYALDLHGDPLADRWYATLHATEGFFESVVHKVLLALDAAALATAFIPIVGDIVGFVADVARIGWDLIQDGPSWGLAGRTLMAVGFAAVGLAANLGGPPAWGAKAAIRSRTLARAVHALDAGVEVARGVDAASDASRALHAVDGVADAARALPDPGAAMYWATNPKIANASEIAEMKRLGAEISASFEGHIRTLFTGAKRLLAQAPVPIAQRKVFDQAFWGGIRGRDACGPTAVAMILSDFGIRLNAQLRQIVSFGLGHVGAGTSPMNLVRGLHAMGFGATRAINTAGDGVAAVKAAGRASRNGHHVIAAINVFDASGAFAGRHWILIDKVIAPTRGIAAEGRVLTRDPGGFKKIYTLKELAGIAYGPIIAVAR